MSYALRFNEAPAASIERVRREQLEAAAGGLREDATDPEAIHDARKRLKKTRALLRLARPGMTRKAFQRRNRALRDAGRALSAARDAEGLAGTGDDLPDRYPGRAAYGPVHVTLADRTAEPDGSGETLDPLVATGWDLDGLTPDMLTASLTRTYARGREAFAMADRRPTSENLHEWRKRVKDLWYQERLICEAWPEVLKAQAAEAKTLSKLLGDDHDLAALAELLDDEPELRDFVTRRRGELLDAVRGLGRRVYAETPKAFGRRVDRYLAAPAV